MKKKLSILRGEIIGDGADGLSLQQLSKIVGGEDALVGDNGEDIETEYGICFKWYIVISPNCYREHCGFKVGCVQKQ